MSRQPASVITRIRAYQIDLPLREGRYAWSGGNAVEVFDATVVAIDTAGGTHRLGRGLPARPGLPAGLCGGRAHRHRGTGAAAARARRLRARRS